jgi:hypothetical protein
VVHKPSAGNSRTARTGSVSAARASAAHALNAFFFQARQDRRHRLARDALVGAQIEQLRQSGAGVDVGRGLRGLALLQNDGDGNGHGQRGQDKDLGRCLHGEQSSSSLRGSASVVR